MDVRSMELCDLGRALCWAILSLLDDIVGKSSFYLLLDRGRVAGCGLMRNGVFVFWVSLAWLACLPICCIIQEK